MKLRFRGGRVSEWARVCVSMSKSLSKSDTQKTWAKYKHDHLLLRKKKSIYPEASMQLELASCSNQPNYLLTENIAGQCQLENSKSVEFEGRELWIVWFSCNAFSDNILLYWETQRDTRLPWNSTFQFLPAILFHYY